MPRGVDGQTSFRRSSREIERSSTNFGYVETRSFPPAHSQDGRISKTGSQVQSIHSFFIVCRRPPRSRFARRLTPLPPHSRIKKSPLALNQMPIYKCRQCPTREFVSRVALFQHYRQSTPGQHPFCVPCDKYFNTKEGLDAHNWNDHQFECTTCQQKFHTQSSLEDHYRGKASTIHPNCSRCGKGFFNASAVDEHFKEAHPSEQCPCGHNIFVEDLPRHYTESIHHPTCLRCATGFKDDAAYNAHGAAEHPECRCTQCLRQFNSQKELQDHFDASDFHPKCLKCGKVGFRNDASLNEHIAEMHVLSPPMEVAALAQPFKDLLAIEAPPATSRLSRTSLPLPGKEANALWNSTENRVVPPIPLEPWMASTAFISSDKGDVSMPGGRNLSQMGTEQNFVPCSQIAFRSLSETATIRTDQSESYKSRSSNGSVASTTTSVFSDHIPKTISPQSSTSSFSSFVDLGEGSSSAISGSMMQGQSVTSPRSVVIPAACVRCLVCKGRCIEPTATFCGHVFCNNCITQRIAKTAACPQCAKPTLLYCLFRLHLDG
ncbi:hypothetical protein B0H12DRAFT_212016 [Mycena haematopus]|nr:hypothetical protein B0H12DRAFT_212016 [Mycena haematopus]